ncbi:MAG: hypothetical protein OFPI_40030 [Osedax symbiont Rs2]|nr:MAG: hypothetical protein OFPI_40030 [Osedax symbiont Rs2]
MTISLLFTEFIIVKYWQLNNISQRLAQNSQRFYSSWQSTINRLFTGLHC